MERGGGAQINQVCARVARAGRLGAVPSESRRMHPIRWHRRPTEAAEWDAHDDMGEWTDGLPCHVQPRSYRRDDLFGRARLIRQEAVVGPEIDEQQIWRLVKAPWAARPKVVPGATCATVKTSYGHRASAFGLGTARGRQARQG